MRVAALDLGTNTFLCLVAEVENGTITKVLADESRIVRLGEGVHKNRYLLPEALERADVCLAEFRKIINKHSVQKVSAVATSAARDAKNGAELFKLGEKYKIPIETISGANEAEISFLGIVSDRSDKNGLWGLDIGGGSTEVMGQGASGKIEGRSVDVGAVRLTEMFVSKHPVSDVELEKMESFAKEKLKIFSNINPKELICAAGTPTTFAAIDQGIDFNALKIHGYKMSAKKIREITKKLASLSLEERKKVKGLEAGRADVIVGGGVILAAAAEIIGSETFTVSIRGIRYGLALDLGKDLS